MPHVFISGEPLTYKATVRYTDGANSGETMWECDHIHDTYQEAIDCGEAYVRAKLSK